MQRRPPTGPVAVPDVRPSAGQDEPGESMGTMLAAAIRTTEPGSDQFKALIATIDGLLKPNASPARPSKLTVLGIIAAIGLVAPTMEQILGNFMGPGADRLDAIELQLDELEEERRQQQAAMADLIRFVERVEIEQAHSSQRSPAVMPARLRALVANDEIAAEAK